MATSCPCYNHDDRSAVWSCLDCKPDCVTKFCKECHDHVHSLPVFRLHRTQTINQGEKRRLSQDISDLEKLVVVEKDILNGVLTTLRYTEQQEREMIQDVVKKTEQRLHNIQQCHEKVDKALMYLAKASLGVSTVITSCSTPNLVPAQTLSKELSAEQQHQVATTSDLPHFPVDVVGSLNKSGCFWMVKKSAADRQQLAQIDHDLREHFKLNPDTAPPPSLKEGTIYVAKTPANTEFWRIKVEKLCSNEMVKVRYLDYGMQEELPTHSIADLPPIFKAIPYQAMECCLFPLTTQISLPYEAKWCFKDLTHGKELAASVCSKMIYPQGHSLYHIQLTSAGPLPVNINQKVADLLAQKELDDEDHPALPKDGSEETKVEENNVTVVVQPSTELTPSSIISQDPSARAPEEPQKKNTILTRSTDSGKEPTQKDVFKKPLDAMTGVTREASVMIPEYVPIGYVNEQMYCSIYNECNTNKPALRSLISRGRYFLTKGNERQFVESMKTKVWCCLDEKLALVINNAYKDQASKQNAVLLIFVVPKFFIGLVRIVSELNRPCPHCTIVSPGLLWGHACRGEFDIQLFSVDKFRYHCLENDSYLQIFFKDNVLGREIRFQKGEEICNRYERPRKPNSVLDFACRMYKKDNTTRDFRSSQENLSEDEEPLSWRIRREDSKTTEESKAVEVSKAIQDSIANEDWEPDLDALPTRVAEIYTSLSSPSVSQDGSGEGEKPEESENTEDTQTAAVNDETSTTDATNKEVKELDEPVVQNAEKAFGPIVESDDGCEVVKEELVVDEAQTMESKSQDSIGQTENQESTDDNASTMEETQAEADTQVKPPESNFESNQNVENADETEHIHQNITKVGSHPDDQASTSENLGPQDLLHQENDSDVSPIQATPDDVNISKDTHPPITFEDKEQFPSYMPLGETLCKGGSSKGLPENNQQLTGQPVAGAVESQENKEMFYYVLSPPQTPSSITTNKEVLKVDKEMNKIADEETKKADVNGEGTSTETEVTERASCSGISDDTKGTSTASSFNAHQDHVDEDERTDDIDDDEAFLPVEPGQRCSVFVKLDSAHDEDIFWARIIRTNKEETEYCRFSKDLQNWAQTSEELSNVHLLRYCCYKNLRGHYTRNLITKVHRDHKVTVHCIDNAVSCLVPVCELRELHEQFVMDMPPQAFECRFLNQSMFKEKCKRFKPKKTVEVEIRVKSITGEVAEVECIGVHLIAY